MDVAGPSLACHMVPCRSASVGERHHFVQSGVVVVSLAVPRVDHRQHQIAEPPMHTWAGTIDAGPRQGGNQSIRGDSEPMNLNLGSVAEIVEHPFTMIVIFLGTSGNTANTDIWVFLYPLLEVVHTVPMKVEYRHRTQPSLVEDRQQAVGEVRLKDHVDGDEEVKGTTKELDVPDITLDVVMKILTVIELVLAGSALQCPFFKLAFTQAVAVVMANTMHGVQTVRA